MKRQTLRPILGLLLLLLPLAAHAGDFLVIPGERIGAVFLGMDRASVHMLLHAPNTMCRLAGGVVLDTWLSRASLPKSAAEHGNYLKHDYLSVFFQHGRAVQIEVSSPQFKTAQELSTGRSADDFAKRYPRFQAPRRLSNGNSYVWGNSDPSASSPAAKHYVLYGDAAPQGIAWKYGAWGDLAPEADPDGPLETVIVHVPGRIVLLNPNDGRPCAGTGPAQE